MAEKKYLASEKAETVEGADFSGIRPTITDDDILISPNGTGAIRARVDGDPRGDNAVCLVPAAAVASQVAAGNSSVAIGVNARTYQIGGVADSY